MPTFQENLTEQSRPVQGAIPTLPSAPTPGTSIARGIGAVTGLVNQGLATLDKIGSDSATSEVSNAALKLIEEHDQGQIDDLTYRRKKKALAIEMRRNHEGFEGEVVGALRATFGADPIVRQETAEALTLQTFIDKGRPSVGIEASDEKAAKSGESMFQAESKTLQMQGLA